MHSDTCLCSFTITPQIVKPYLEEWINWATSPWPMIEIFCALSDAFRLYFDRFWKWIARSRLFAASEVFFVRLIQVIARTWSNTVRKVRSQKSLIFKCFLRLQQSWRLLWRSSNLSSRLSLKAAKNMRQRSDCTYATPSHHSFPWALPSAERLAEQSSGKSLSALHCAHKFALWCSNCSIPCSSYSPEKSYGVW